MASLGTDVTYPGNVVDSMNIPQRRPDPLSEFKSIWRVDLKHPVVPHASLRNRAITLRNHYTAKSQAFAGLGSTGELLDAWLRVSPDPAG